VSKMVFTFKKIINVIDPNPKMPSSITKFYIFWRIKFFPNIEIVNIVPATRNS
jgi:hypothetical protein